MDELQRQLKAFSKTYGLRGQMMEDRIKALLAQGKSPKEAIEQTFKEFGVEDWLQASVSSVIVETAKDALGMELAGQLSEAVLLEALSNPWDGSGLTLSKKIHGTSESMKEVIVETVQNQIRLNQTVRDTAQTLYDGYQYGSVVRQQDLPKYMDDLMRWTRRSRENLTEAETRDLQRAIRKVRAQADELIDDKSTYNHFRTSLRTLLDRIDKGSEKSVQKAISAAIEEKSRYVAERIARTEAARARYDAFIARYGEDDSVAAYKWTLGSRHPVEDICDMYAEADLYGLGKGVFPKDKAPVNPAHPHCLCHYAPVYESEIESRKPSKDIEANGNAWLKKQPITVQEKILGVKGRLEWKAGRASWMEKARNISPVFEKKESRFKQLILQLHSRNKNGIKFTKDDIINQEIPLSEPLKFTTPEGVLAFIPNSTLIKVKKIIAGVGSDVVFRNASRYASKFGGDVKSWQKLVGVIESDRYSFDVHWARRIEDGLNVRFKIKNLSERRT